VQWVKAQPQKFDLSKFWTKFKNVWQRSFEIFNNNNEIIFLCQ